MNKKILNKIKKSNKKIAVSYSINTSSCED